MAKSPLFQADSSDGSTSVIFDGIGVLFDTDKGMWTGKNLSDDAIRWLMNNEAGFNERIEEIANIQQRVQREQREEQEKTSDKKAKPEPKSGHIYIVHAVGTNQYKIGLTTAKNPNTRIGNIQTSSPVEIETVATFRVANPQKEESKIHKKLKKYRKLGEWFKIKDRAIINRAIQSYGVSI